LGPKQGASVAYHVGFWWAFSGAASFVLVLGALALPSNRRRAAWWIWVPLGVVFLARGLLVQVIPLPTPDLVAVVTWSLGSLALGIALLWLLGEHFRFRGALSTFLRAMLILALSAVVAWALLEGLGTDSPLVAPGLIICGSSLLVLLGGMGYAVWRWRKRQSGLRFAGGFFFGCFVAALPIGAVAALIAVAADGGWGYTPWHEIVLGGLIAGLISALVVFIITLPFLILTFKNAFYRDRFQRVFAPKKAREPHPEGGDVQVPESGKAELAPPLPSP